ncbi:hypothetical protein Q75_00860 [Bacillus coahuilensis p1.1.43]|uniref:Uncharacterized protein n=1 Tax=Bacillus coahuilensis p1.1.43 TaxID=1150625 RepID=A0A147KC74_9BACI|nr:hypothetical protein Q75_00860 [Bacillus coahuilensis p1.1.43]
MLEIDCRAVRATKLEKESTGKLDFGACRVLLDASSVLPNANHPHPDARYPQLSAIRKKSVRAKTPNEIPQALPKKLKRPRRLLLPQQETSQPQQSP